MNHMNISNLAQSLGIETQDYKSLVELFLQTTSDDLQKLDSAIAERDLSLVSQTAHHIKGAAVNLELQEIAADARKAEQCAKQSDFNGVSQAGSNIRAELEAISRALSKDSE